jgi:hypothetical protein
MDGKENKNYKKGDGREMRSMVAENVCRTKCPYAH